ncbi:MAG: hypothetical protein WD066_18165 [Planctomycetaceae bacterium]
MTAPIALPSRTQYICPGETHPISRSVHLARLAAFFPACRDCPLRSDVGHLSVETKQRLESTRRRVPRASLFTVEGVRGVHLNELTRPLAARIATAFAHLLWEEFPTAARSESPASRATPAVVVAHDERPSAPDLVTGVVSALRRMSCRVIDIRLATTPVFRFAVDHLQAHGGIFVTGSGHGPAWMGMDFVRAAGRPSSRETEGAVDSRGGLERLEAEVDRPHERPVRHGGAYRTFQAALPYEAGLWKHFHALRPLRIVCGSPLSSQRRLLEKLFERLPCTLVANALPVRRRDVNDPEDADVRRVAEAVRREHAHLGVVIDDDAQAGGFLDETGELVPRDAIARMIADVLLSESPGRRIAVAGERFDALHGAIAALGGEPIDAGRTQAAMWQAVSEGAIHGIEGNRHWFHEASPASDAILSLARVLQALSRGDAPLSAMRA